MEEIGRKIARITAHWLLRFWHEN